MTTASQLRGGMAIRFEGEIYRVLHADYHPGQGKMGGVSHARLRNLNTGTVWEHSFRAEMKLEELAVGRQTLEFLYTGPDGCHFMQPDTYEQLELPLAMIGDQVRFLGEGMRLPVEFVEGRPVSVVFPETVDVTIADTPPPLHSRPDDNWKPARLENGVEVMVPPFVKTGDAIRLQLAGMRYMDRVKAKAS